MEQAGNRDFIIGEDMHAGGNLINCGVFLVRVCEWSLALFEEVWELKVKKRGKDTGVGWYIEFFFLGFPLCRRLGVCPFGISRRKVNIFWHGGDFFPYGAHDILAPQPKAKNWRLED